MDVIFYVLGHLPYSLAIFAIPILMLGDLFSSSYWAENRFDTVIQGVFPGHHSYFFSGCGRAEGLASPRRSSNAFSCLDSGA
jgi:hypothetical protein